ncbi:MAG: response regulator transcription factor [Syntrophobacterales bacterium]|jgi:DNA-binding NarL/FixJ family response regulator
MKRVYVVDDSDFVRERLIEMLSELEEVEIVGGTGDPQEALAAIGEMLPDAVILDIRLPGRSGVEVLRDLKKEEPSPIVIILTNYPYPQYRKECTEAGADHFLNKSTEFNEIAEILKGLTMNAQD